MRCQARGAFVLAVFSALAGFGAGSGDPSHIAHPPWSFALRPSPIAIEKPAPRPVGAQASPIAHRSTPFGLRLSTFGPRPSSLDLRLSNSDLQPSTFDLRPSTFAQGETKKEQRPRERPWWGVDVGAYFPTDGEIRDRFGTALFRLGFRPFEPKRTGKWRIVTDLTVISASKFGNHMLLIPWTVGVMSTFGEPDKWPASFVSVGVVPAYMDYAIDRLSSDQTTLIRFSAQKFGASAHVEAGVLLQPRLSVTGRYDWFSQSDDFDFSGFSLTVAYALWRW